MRNAELERYIFNCVARFKLALRQHREDAEQEIRAAILVSDDEREALRLANRNILKMLRQFGHVPKGVRERYEAGYSPPSPR